MGQVFGASLSGGCATLFRVECLVERGLPRVQIVGLPDRAAREACDRLPAAFAAHGLTFPKMKVLFSLSPASTPKRGIPVDLALAIQLLIATHQLPPPATPIVAIGELDLEGQVRPPDRGVLLVAAASAELGAETTLAVAQASAHEASLLHDTRLAVCSNLREAVDQLQNLPCRSAQTVVKAQTAKASSPQSCLSEIRGQELARDAAIYCAAGRHSMLLQGPPGTGKSMLAQRISDLLPPLTRDQAIALASVESVHGALQALPSQPPFRAPHHTVSPQALLGGGRPIYPGEISRAHGGVLFLDELPEFSRTALEGLRQPLEEGVVRIERCQESAKFPARPLLVAARNPCPCGYASHPTRACTCTPAALRRYQLRTSGPLLDRMDLFVEMGPVSPRALHGPPTSPTTAEALDRLAMAQEIQLHRQKHGHFGVASGAKQAQILAAGVEASGHRKFLSIASRQQWSGRALLRALRVARTIADCHAEQTVSLEHLMQAVAFRPPVDSELMGPLPAEQAAKD